MSGMCETSATGDRDTHPDSAFTAGNRNIVNIDDVAGLTELSVMLGVPRQYIWNRAKRGAFPQPVGELAATRLWLKSEVMYYAAQHPEILRKGDGQN